MSRHGISRVIYLLMLMVLNGALAMGMYISLTEATLAINPFVYAVHMQNAIISVIGVSVVNIFGLRL